MAIDIRQLLLTTVEMNASDLQLLQVNLLLFESKERSPSQSTCPLTKWSTLVGWLYPHRSTESTIRRRTPVDFSFAFEGKARFRVNIFMQSKGVSIALRRIPATVLTLRDLDSPPVLETIAGYRRGLVVTGPTGSESLRHYASLITSIEPVKNIY